MDVDNVPDRRRYGYKELEEKLDSHVAELESRFAKFMRGALVAFAIIGLMSSASIVAFGFLLKEQGLQADEIQQQRRETILRSCNEQNRRHDDTLREFHILAKKAAKKHPEQAARIKEAVKGNLRLIESLVPKRPCAQIAAQAVEQ